MKLPSPKILTIFNPAERDVLKQAVAPIELGKLSDREFMNIIKDLTKAMKKHDGVGIAANQLGWPYRIAIISGQAQKPRTKDLWLINPEITWSSPETVEIEEGCLSVPGVYGLVQRPEMVKITSLTPAGQIMSLDAAGGLARVIQHEIDHLNGIVFTDRTNKITQGAEKL
jgi:peptide deformylase